MTTTNCQMCRVLCLPALGPTMHLKLLGTETWLYAGGSALIFTVSHRLTWVKTDSTAAVPRWQGWGELPGLSGGSQPTRPKVTVLSTRQDGADHPDRHSVSVRPMTHIDHWQVTSKVISTHEDPGHKRTKRVGCGDAITWKLTRSQRVLTVLLFGASNACW